MLELDDDLLDYLALVRGHYLTCFVDAIEHTLERTGRQPGRVGLEAKVSLEQGGAPILHIVDLVEIGPDDTVQPIHVMHRSSAPWKATTYELEGGATLHVEALVWFSVVLISSPAPQQSIIDAWFERWHDGTFEVEQPFAGRVHFMDCNRNPDLLAIMLDLGSAPVEAIRDLIERCVTAGARMLSIGSGEEALAGTLGTGALEP